MSKGLKVQIDNLRKRGRPKKRDTMVTLSVRIYERQMQKLDHLGTDRGAIIRSLIDDA